MTDRNMGHGFAKAFAIESIEAEIERLRPKLSDSERKKLSLINRTIQKKEQEHD
jgi:hypothetical protein